MEMMYFMFFQHILFPPKLSHIEPSLCFRSQVYIMFFSVCLPKARVIILHKSTMMHTCTGLKAFPLGSGFSFGDVKPFELIFPLIYYGGSLFFPLLFIFSARGASWELSWANVFWSSGGALSVCSGWMWEVLCFFGGQWKYAVWYFKGCSICVWEPNRQRHRLPDLLQGASGIWNEEEVILSSSVCLFVFQRWTYSIGSWSYYVHIWLVQLMFARKI